MKNITDKKLESILKNLSSEAKPEKMFIHSLEKKLQKQFEKTYSQQPSFFSRFLKLKLQFASALVIVFFTSTTIYAYSSDTVVNGDLLYPIKRSVEKVEGIFATTPEKKTEYYTKMADRRMEEFTHIEQKRNRIDKPTLKEAKRLIELSEKEFTEIEEGFETRPGDRIQLEPEDIAPLGGEIQPEMGMQLMPEAQGQFQPTERIIKVKEKIDNTKKHFEEKFEPKLKELEELEELEREIIREVMEEMPLLPQQLLPPQLQPSPQQNSNFQQQIQNKEHQQPQQQIQQPSQQQQQQQFQPTKQQPIQQSQTSTPNFPIQPEINNPEQPQPLSDYLKISTPEKEMQTKEAPQENIPESKNQLPPSSLTPSNIFKYTDQPQPKLQPFPQINEQNIKPITEQSSLPPD